MTVIGLRRIALLLGAVLLVGGCPGRVMDQLPGPVAQLGRWETAEAERRPADIIRDPLSSDCTAASAGSEACPRLHAIRARACWQQAQAQSAARATCPGPDARDLVACAVEHYGAVADERSFTQPQREEFRQMRGHAGYCLANLVGGAEHLRLGRQATEDLALLGPTPRRDHLAANAWQLLAGAASGPARCDGLRRAATLARRGLANGPDEDTAGGLRAALADARSAARQAACEES